MWLKKATVGGIGQYSWSSPDETVEVPDALGGQLLAIPGNDFTEVATPAPAKAPASEPPDAETPASTEPDDEAVTATPAAAAASTGRRGGKSTVKE
jgi:hypothetical protein